MANGIVLNIDTTKSEFQNPMVQLRQGDGNYQSLSVTVTSNGEPFDLTGWTTTFMGTTAGGFKIIDSASVVTNALQGEFTYTPTKAWGQDEGEFKNAYFKFTKSDETASGASFRVNVLDAVDLTAEEAGDYISIVDQTIGKLTGDLSALQSSVDQLKSQNNAIKTSDNTWTGSNTFNKKIIAPAGIQGNADTATKLQTPRKINGTNFDGTADINVNAANDSNLVHRTGNETVAGDKTFTGNAIFNNLIDGYTKTKETPTNDINLIKTPGKYRLQSTYLNIPSGMPNSAIMFVEDNVDHTIIYQTILTRDVDGLPNGDVDMFIRLSIDSNWTPWRKLAQDQQVMHLIGTETVAGDKSFTGNNTFTQNISGNITGNSATTTKLQTPRKINGTNFDGTADINVNAANDSNLVHKNGTEVVTGDKTFTGTNTFTGQTSFWFKQIQWTSGIMQGTWYIQRIGNWVNAKFDMSANPSTGTTTLSLPVGYRPLSPFVRELEQGGAGISQNGTIFISQSYTGANAMTFSYPTNDPWATA